MLVSIITVNFNNAIGLERTIQSIINQNYLDIEYIIIDGGSTDASVDIIKKYEPDITYWISEKDNGIYNAMNKGILKAKGEYILFINSGDYLLAKNVITKMIEDEDGSRDLIYGNLERTFKNGKKDFVAMPSTLDPVFLLNASLCHPTTLIKKNLFNKYGLYDESFKIIADWAFFIKVLLVGNVTYIHKPISVTMFYMDGLSSLISTQSAIGNEKNKVIHLYFNPILRKTFEDLKYYKKKHRKIYYLIGTVVELYTKKITKSIARKINLIIYYIYRCTFFYVQSLHTAYTFKKQKQKLLTYCRNIPIIINNRNRLTYLQQLINSLEKRGYNNIFIIDNASNYVPLLDYYNALPYKVFKLNKNVGHYALWDTNIYEQFKNDYYVYTDSDIELTEECPDDFMVLLYILINKYRTIKKVGFSIKIDDLPDYYPFKKEVLEWETKFHIKKKEKLAYWADIDTTFALYKPNSFRGKQMFKALRTNYPYQIRHLPWYENHQTLTEEQKYYYQNIQTSTYWSSLILPKIIQ